MSKKKYTTGQHGAKKREQQRLSKKYKTKVTGKTHESEHTVGFQPLNNSSVKRGETKEIRNLENKAPAYQEEKKHHRSHIGTGNRKKKDASGFNSKTYRETQRKLIENSDVSSAVQINQLGYAFLKEFQKMEKTATKEASDDSYKNMVEQLDSITFKDGEKEKTIKATPLQKAEMYLARQAARTGKWPTEEEIYAAKKKFKVK